MSNSSKTTLSENPALKAAHMVTLSDSGLPSAPLEKAKDKSLIDRLKKSGLEPQKLLELTLSSTSGKAFTKTRHRLILTGFFALVLIPSAFFAVYMFFFASDQYHSTTGFAVRSSNSTPATDILGMIFESGSESTSAASYIVTDYLQSQAVLEDLKGSINTDEIFNRPEGDWLFRMGADLPIEDKVDYWNSMVDVSFDSTSGVIYVEVRTFVPQDSVKIARAILARSERLVNELSETNRRLSVQYADLTVARAEARLKAIRKQMLDFRQITQEISPEEGAKIAYELIGGVEERLISKEAEKRTLLNYLDADSPRIRVLSEEIIALKAQADLERQKVGSGRANTDASEPSSRNSLSYRIADYSNLALEEEFSQKLYATALAGLEKARHEADSKQLYLATFIPPTLSEKAQSPNRLLYSLGFFFLLAAIWMTLVLVYYNIRDRT